MAHASGFGLNAASCASLFAGMGGLCIGMERAGFKTLWANEFNEDCLKVYKMNFPETKLIPGDIRTDIGERTWTGARRCPSRWLSMSEFFRSWE